MKYKFFAPVLLFIVAVISLCKADAGQHVRSFRPLEIKQVVIAPGWNAVDVTKRGSEVERALSEAWKQFDAHQWAAAREGFLTVLGQVPRNRLAAEGLAMSLYRSGDYKGAYEFAKQLKRRVPSVQELVSETVVADVQYMISNGEFAAASGLLGNFPSMDSEYGRAHELLRGAYAISRALEAAGNTTAHPAEPSSQHLAKN